MKIYLVGGAVRDNLLGYPVRERDWVVVGAKPADLLAQGYQQVGRDFPVFLHPETHEEYALARMERKNGRGYYGFDCDYNPEIRLEDDLMRRDLTINAMAIDEQGQLVDPYHGQADLKAKILRHVSPAFIEDPVRVLRVARFMARYHHLGFKLADETRLLMQQMVDRGELAHLIVERVWQEWHQSFEEKNPELFIYTLRSCGALRVILPELDQLFGVPNPNHYHPEIDSGVHSLMVLCCACALSADPLVRFAALIHDLGKGQVPMNLWPALHGHEQLGLKVIGLLSDRLKIPKRYREFALMVCQFHLDIHRVSELRASTIVRILEKTHAFRDPSLFDKLLTVCEADAKGKGLGGDYPTIPWIFQRVMAPDLKHYPPLHIWRAILNECSKITTRDILEQGFTGLAIKQKLHEKRVNWVKQFISKT